MVAISYDPPETNSNFTAEEGLPFLLLSDQGAQTVIGFDIRNKEYDAGHFAYGIPYPGIVLVNRDGKIVLKMALPDYRERPSLDDLIAKLNDAIS